MLLGTGVLLACMGSFDLFGWRLTSLRMTCDKRRAFGLCIATWKSRPHAVLPLQRRVKFALGAGGWVEERELFRSERDLE